MSPNNICTECGDKIKTMCFKGTGFCCDLCRKGKDKGDATRSSPPDRPNPEGDLGTSGKAKSASRGTEQKPSVDEPETFRLRAAATR